MTQSTVHYRPFQPSDYHDLEMIIRKTWKYDQLGSPKAAKLLAKIDLASCLVNQTYTCVAVSGGKPVGIVMGKNRKRYHKPLRFLIRKNIAAAQIAMSREAREIIKVFSKIDRINYKLLKSINVDFDAELSFFVVSDDQRGKGIGKQLYQRFLDYIESENLKTFFLFTDTSCTYQFYDYQGLERMAEETFNIPESQKNMELYVYGKV